MSKVIVIGSNHAGTACIQTLLSSGNQNVTVYDSNDNISFLGCGIALWIGGQIDGYEGLFYANRDVLEKKGAKVFLEHTVKDINFENKTIEVLDKNGNLIQDSYDKLVLATGSLPIILNIKGKDLKNVQKVKIFQDAKEIVDKLSLNKFKRVAILGAGYIGVELAEAFQRRGLDTTLIDKSDRILSTHFDKEFTDIMHSKIEEKGVKIRLGESVVEFEGNENQEVTAVVTDKGSYPVDMVISCIGFVPNTSLAKDKLETLKNGAYKVNKKQETSIKDVYAIGDSASVFDNSTQDFEYIALATNAVRSGIVAALNILGKDVSSLGVQGSSGISIYDYKMVSTGISEEFAKRLGIEVNTTSFDDLQKPEFIKSENKEVKIKIVYRKDTRVIVGCQIASYYDISGIIHTFSLAIQEQLTIDKIALLDIFFMPHFNKPYNYITMAALGAK